MSNPNPDAPPINKFKTIVFSADDGHYDRITQELEAAGKFVTVPLAVREREVLDEFAKKQDVCEAAAPAVRRKRAR